jgi:penicillin-binding protein 1B
LLIIAALACWALLTAVASGERAVRALQADTPSAPVEVLAAPTILRLGDPLDLAAFEAGLERQGYKRVPLTVRDPGEFSLARDRIQLFRRRHEGPSGTVGPRAIEVRVAGGKVVWMRDGEGRAQSVFTTEPELLGAFRGPGLEDRSPRELEAFPRRLVTAVLAAEDARFETHSGVDLRAIARAAWAAIRRKGLLQGGSTITQQVIRNRLVGRERTLMRKVREAALALWVEGRIPKRRILEIYLNEVYLGQRGSVSVVGLPAAAKHWFGKDLADLDLDEQALLAGMIASPGRFDPRRNPEAARRRRDWVLGRMAQGGMIGEADRAAAAARPIDPAPLSDSDVAGDVLDAVRRELESRGWVPRPGVRTVRVFTSIDAGLQRAAEHALTRTLGQLEKSRASRSPLEGAVVILRPASGEIAAIVGGRRGTRGGFHRALDARRQPGSAFKPFVALAAFADGPWTPSSFIADERLAVETAQGIWSPGNVDGEYRGRVTVRKALEESRNVPFARLGLELGPERIIAAARAAGIEGRLPAAPSVALGTGELSPLDLARGYATIAALGTRRTPFLVRAVRASGADAGVALRSIDPSRRTGSKSASYMVLDAMAGVTIRGTGRGLTPALRGRIVATKTGTTQDGRDGWFVMISGEAVAVAWVGRDDGRPAGLSGSGSALPVIRRLIESDGDRLLAPLPPAPEDVVIARIDPATGGLATRRCDESAPEVFPRDAVPERCGLHAGFWRRLFGRRGAALDRGR